jgi:hypothetical protein
MSCAFSEEERTKMAHRKTRMRYPDRQQPIPKSPALRSLHEAMADLHGCGAIDNAKMAEFDRRCLTTKGGKPNV